MNEIKINVCGVVGTKPETKVINDETSVTSFRMVSRSRWFDRRTQQWVDGPPSWFTVSCWRQLAANVRGSNLDVGSRVIVHGRLTVQRWSNGDQQWRERAQIEADAIGFNLADGTAVFERVKRWTTSVSPEQREADALADAVTRASAEVDAAVLLDPDFEPDLDPGFGPDELDEVLEGALVPSATS